MQRLHRLFFYECPQVLACSGAFPHSVDYNYHFRCAGICVGHLSKMLIFSFWIRKWTGNYIMSVGILPFI